MKFSLQALCIHNLHANFIDINVNLVVKLHLETFIDVKGVVGWVGL